MELALKYMEIFFSGVNVDELGHLFAEDFTFKGPLYEFDSAEEYINALKADPPQGFKYEVIGSFETDASACLVYQFTKPGVSTLMAQLFEVSEGRIRRILLIFDSAALT